jgi:hypothetical protein
MPPQTTAAEVIKVDTPNTGSAQDSLHIKKDGTIVFAIDADGNVIVGDLEGIEGSLPTPVGETDGLVLTVDTDEAVWAEAASGIPDPVGETDGFVLTVDTDEAVWAAPATELPSTVGAEQGSFLKIDGDPLTAEWDVLEFNEIPDPVGETDGYQLVVDTDEAVWAAPPVPTAVGRPNGEVLTVSEDAAVWDAPGLYLPTPEGEDNDLVLTVEDEVAVWALPQQAAVVGVQLSKATETLATVTEDHVDWDEVIFDVGTWWTAGSPGALVVPAGASYGGLYEVSLHGRIDAGGSNTGDVHYELNNVTRDNEPLIRHDGTFIADHYVNRRICTVLLPGDVLVTKFYQDEVADVYELGDERSRACLTIIRLCDAPAGYVPYAD